MFINLSNLIEEDELYQIKHTFFYEYYFFDTDQLLNNIEILFEKLIYDSFNINFQCDLLLLVKNAKLVIFIIEKKN